IQPSVSRCSSVSGASRRRLRVVSSCVFHSFFFSSRRRHTRFDCDWSSDVCSSDLIPSAEVSERLAPALGMLVSASTLLRRLRERSEERRVGKDVHSGRLLHAAERTTYSSPRRVVSEKATCGPRSFTAVNRHSTFVL